MGERAVVPRLLFGLACAAAGLLVLPVAAGPWLGAAAAWPGDWGRLAELFAHDAALRRTCLASAVGLVVTACVFFRPAGPGDARPPRRARRPRTPGAAGA